MTLETRTEICSCPDWQRGRWIGRTHSVPQHRGRGEIVSAQPVLAQHDAVGRQSPDILDESREMKCDLRIGRLIAAFRWCYHLGLT